MAAVSALDIHYAVLSSDGLFTLAKSRPAPALAKVTRGTGMPGGVRTAEAATPFRSRLTGQRLSGQRCTCSWHHMPQHGCCQVRHPGRNVANSACYSMLPVGVAMACQQHVDGATVKQ